MALLVFVFASFIVVLSIRVTMLGSRYIPQRAQQDNSSGKTGM
jgi:hypothetical protein